LIKTVEPAAGVSWGISGAIIWGDHGNGGGRGEGIVKEKKQPDQPTLSEKGDKFREGRVRGVSGDMSVLAGNRVFICLPCLQKKEGVCDRPKRKAKVRSRQGPWGEGGSGGGPFSPQGKGVYHRIGADGVKIIQQGEKRGKRKCEVWVEEGNSQVLSRCVGAAPG